MKVFRFLRPRWKRLVSCLILTYVVVYVTKLGMKQKEKAESKNDEELILHDAKVRNEDLLANVKMVCKQYNMHNPGAGVYPQPPAPQFETLYYDKSHALLWCPVYKAGSSNWLYNFAILAGYTKQEINESKRPLHDLVREKIPQLQPADISKVFNSSLKFMFVRHPFERILSAYRDKLENVNRGGDSWYYYNLYGGNIVTKFRKGGNDTNSRAILKEGQYLWDKDHPLGIEPTFQEFVKYLTETDLVTRADDHWIPFYLACTPCLVEYSIIGKVESMFEDQILVIHNAHLQHVIEPIWRHRTNPINKQFFQLPSDIAKLYFSQLTAQDIQNLYYKYKLDFELFGYHTEPYFKILKKV